jgi:aspartyl/asparaginyl beta-hydroxylase (cupin superfamily)
LTPNDDRCFIEVDGIRYSWRDGEAVIFDETYIHWAAQQYPTATASFFSAIWNEK